ncbi:MAG: hypothetical protein QM572_18125 [Nocardioides sp.]|uniref:hypothetical protein n=1 Tax=Nocardioides sp. TaxID=35761 RepID=UPI0039E29C17
MLPFWASDVVLVSVQAALVCAPQPQLPARLVDRLRGRAWAWVLLPGSLGGTIALLAAVPSLAGVYAWVAALGVPLLAAVAIGSAARRTRAAGVLAVLSGGGLAAALLALAWAGPSSGLAAIPAQAAAVALTALSAATLAAWLTRLAPSLVLQIALVAMAVLDCVLVFGHLLQGPNDTLNAASAGGGLPHLQVAHFQHALMGYGDLFVAAVLGSLIAQSVPGAAGRAWPPRWTAALLVLGLSGIFDLLFLVVDTLPATVPVAVALLLMRLLPCCDRFATTNG